MSAGWTERWVKKKKIETVKGLPSSETTQKHSWGGTVSWVFPGFGYKTRVRVGNGVDAGEQRVSSRSEAGPGVTVREASHLETQ